MANQPKYATHQKEESGQDAQKASDPRSSQSDALVESFPGAKVAGQGRVLGIAEQMELEEQEEARKKME